MVEKIKTDLRIKHDQLDADIKDNIDACLLDLKRVGIFLPAPKEPNDHESLDHIKDPLMVKAIKLFCRWHYNYENQADRYRLAYQSLRDALSLCGDYRE